MTKFIAVASCKGGTGKTTTTINLASALKELGRDVIVLDANSNNPDIGLYLGATHVPVFLSDVLCGRNSLNEAMYMHTSGLKIIPNSINIEKLRKQDVTKFPEVLKRLRGMSELVLIDSGNINKEFFENFRVVDEIIIVTTPDIVSVANAVRVIKLAEENNVSVIGIILNKVKGDSIELSADNIEKMLEKPVLASIAESDDIRMAHVAKQPIVFYNPNSTVSVSYKKLASFLIGAEYRERIPDMPKKSFLFG